MDWSGYIAYDILNHTLIRPILKKTLYELWKDRKSNLDYFHTFGCRCFIHNNGKDNLENFDTKSDEGIFLGYSTSSKAYRVFNKRTLVVEESIHVVFDESLPNKSKKLKDDEEEVNKNFEKDNQDKQTSINNEEENDKDEDTIEPIDPSLPRDWRYANSHPKDQIIGDPSQGVKTRSTLRNLDNYLAFVSQIELKSIEEAECDSD